MMHLLHLTILFLYCPILFCFEVDLSFPEKFHEGETRYKELAAKSYGSCWHEALLSLHSGCKHLTEEIQSRLALSFTNCFLGYAGLQTCLCPDETPISSCLHNSSDRVFSTYTEFYTHTQSICHYLQHREWQHQTERTVQMLSEKAEVVVEKLDKSSDSLSKVLDMQKVASFEQRRLITNGRVLNEELQKSRTHAKHVFEDFKSTTNEQKLLIFAVFDRIKSLQNLVLGEFTTVYTIAFYTAAVFLTYILTSLPQTANARLWLMLVILTTVVVERSIASNSLDEEMSRAFPLDDNGPMYTRIWICRKIACITGLTILIYVYYNFKDYNAINNKLLREIQQQNSDLQQFIKSIKIGESTSTPYNNGKVEALSREGPNHLNLPEPIPSGIKIGESTSTPYNNWKVEALSRKGPNHLNLPEPIPLEILTSPLNSPAVIMRKVTPKKTPLKPRSQRKQSNTPKENVALSSIENISETGSGQKRYNLRSRTSSPAQSPFEAKQLPFQPKDLIDAVSKHF